MAAAIKALNAKIRSNPVSDYLCSTHFWGPASNFGIPIAAVMDTQKDADIISGPMTVALVGYSATFMRYAFAVTPRNYLLFGCHVVNFSAQVTQGYRYVNYWHLGGREARAALEGTAQDAKAQGEALLADAKGGARKVEAKVQAAVEEAKLKVQGK